MRDIGVCSEPGDNKCVRCGTHLCSKCTSRNTSVCPSCIKWIQERYKVPEEYYKKAFLKNKEKIPEVKKKTYEELMDETDTDFTLRNIPAGQRQVLESTAVSSGSDVTVLETDSGAGDRTPRNDTSSGDRTVKPQEKVEEVSPPEDGEPFLNVSDRKKSKKERQQAKKLEATKQKEETCTHFKAGKCRHGFGGDKPHGETQKCRFAHPKVCRKYLNNGTHSGGCSKGENCELLHLKICHFSLKDRKCPNYKPGQRCELGYHLIKTTLPSQEPSGSGSGQQDNSSGDTSGGRSDGGGSDPSVRQSPRVETGGLLGLGKEEFMDFLAKAIKEEVAMAITSFVQTQFQKRKERSGMDYLEALLGGQRPLYSA